MIALLDRILHLFTRRDDFALCDAHTRSFLAGRML